MAAALIALHLVADNKAVGDDKFKFDAWPEQSGKFAYLAGGGLRAHFRQTATSLELCISARQLWPALHALLGGRMIVSALKA